MKVVEFTHISKVQIVVDMCIWNITDHGIFKNITGHSLNKPVTHTLHCHLHSRVDNQLKTDQSISASKHNPYN